jgi:hypothetical protein
MSIKITFQFEDGTDETFYINCERFFLLQLCQGYGKSHYHNMCKYQIFNVDNEISGIYNGFYHGNIVKIMFENCVHFTLIKNGVYRYPIKIGIFDV